MTREPSMIASDPQVSAWVAANAGAGKTYTLANRVARLLLDDTKPQRILCLTFTKAAAAEMQGRLFKQLGEWAMLPDETLRARIAGIGGDPHAPLRKARQLFAEALETPGGLKVLTLHAFCQIVLSRFPIEAGVPPGFEVLDDQSGRAMIAEARQQILERAGNGDARLAAAVALLVTETSEHRLTQVLDAALGGDRRKLDRLLTPDADIGVLARRAHGVAEGETVQGITEDFCGTLDIEVLQAARDWLAGGGPNDIKLANVLSNALTTGDTPSRFRALGDVLLKKDGNPREKFAANKLVDARPELLAYLIALQDRFCAAAGRRKGARAAELAEAALVLIEAVRQSYARAKRLRGVLDYDDLIARTRDLLLKRGAAAWVLYKLDGGIDHVLIDEAQDTSPAQWDIVRALTAEFFAGDGRAQKNPRTIFAVGDEKQSIFSFQGADPSLFEENHKYFAAAAQDAQLPFQNQPLITSRRSVPDILAFVDAVFANPAARDGLTFGDGDIRHEAHRAKDRGGIEFWPTLKPADSEKIDPWQPVDAVQTDSPVARLADQIADKIAGWLRRGARLPGHDAPIQPRDIMILLPRREPFGSEIIRRLKQRQVPVAGADRVRLTEQIAAMDLIALGRFVLQREDDLTLATVLRSPLCSLSEDDLYGLAQGRGDVALWQVLAKRRHDFPAAHDFLAHMLERTDYAPPFEFYSHALTAMSCKERLLARLGPESADAIDEFLSLTLTHEKSHSPSLESFLDWIERGGTEIKRDMERGRNEVRVMTVHGAKGLEADIVILPDTTRLPGGLQRHEGLLYGEDGVLFPLPKADAPDAVRAARAAADEALMKESRRLFYVALTRARDRLCICGFETSKGIREGSWYEMAEVAARQMDLNLTRGDDEIREIGTLGEETGPVAAQASSVRDVLPGWITAPALREPAMPNPIRPSDITGGISGAPPPAFSPLGDGAKRFARGNMVHALLARLPEIAADQRRAIALKFAIAKGFALDAAAALVDETLAVLDDPLFAAAFGPDSRAEVALHAMRPDLGLKAPIIGRIDRLAVTQSEVLILDYKTNRPPPSEEALVAPIYLAQMALYRAGAQVIFPGRRVVCGLLFTDGPRLLQLSDVVLDAQLVGISARLDTRSGMTG